jgi:hypothetical protein
VLTYRGQSLHPWCLDSCLRRNDRVVTGGQASAEPPEVYRATLFLSEALETLAHYPANAGSVPLTHSSYSLRSTLSSQETPYPPRVHFHRPEERLVPERLEHFQMQQLIAVIDLRNAIYKLDQQPLIFQRLD